MHNTLPDGAVVGFIQSHVATFLYPDITFMNIEAAVSW